MSALDEESKILDPCPNCTTLIDVTAIEPFSEVHCPICGTKMRVRTQFNNFALQKILGEGGMGTVFEAIDLNLNRPVAVKILKKEYSADETSIAQLETEARITASISHPHVVKVFSAGRDHGQFYLAMELVGRGTLDQLMNLQGQVAEIQVLDVGMQIADGLRAASQKGLIHRDVKPGNILFSDAHTSKVVDFGLAILMEDEAKSRGEIWGTPYYVAPEKLNNEPEDFRSDIYSLGGTLFHALSGRPPFEAASASLVALKHLKSQAVSLQAFAPDVSNETAYVINRMLHKDPMQRYQSYDELIEHLKYAKTQLQDRTAAGVKPKTRVVVESDATKNITAYITAGLILLMIGMGIYVYTKRATLFAGPDARIPVVQEKAATLADMDSTYEEAINTLSKGQADDAIQLFDQVISSDAPQPLRNWAIFQKGMALNIGGRVEEARELYNGLHKQGLYSEEGNEVRLAGFFVENGRLMKTATPIPGTSIIAYGNKDFEAMALLAFSMKDWALSQFSEAGPMLKKFSEAEPDETYAWIEIYKPLAAKYFSDFQVYEAVEKQVTAAKTPVEKDAALKAVQAGSQKLLITGALPDQFHKWEIILADSIGAAQKSSADAAQSNAQKLLAEETIRWQTLMKKTSDPIHNFSPEIVIPDLKAAQFTSEPLVKKFDTLRQRVDLLAELKTKLIAGMQTAPSHAPLSLRNGTALPGTISRANATSVFMKTPYGETAIAWKDISIASIMALSESAIVDASPDRKKWLTGVYATLCGNEAEGKQLLLDAAQGDASLRDGLAVFFDSAN